MSNFAQKLTAAWPAPFVARKEVARFSGGLLHPRTLANLDSAGLGPARVKYGKIVAYPTRALAEWLAARIFPAS